MMVKPYAIRFPSRNARHTALSAPGGCMSTCGCSCRYRSSLRTCSGGPGGTSCTGQYRHPVSGQRNGFPKSPATRHRRRGYKRLPGLMDVPARMSEKPRYHLRIWSRCQAAPHLCRPARAGSGRASVRASWSSSRWSARKRATVGRTCPQGMSSGAVRGGEADQWSACSFIRGAGRSGPRASRTWTWQVAQSRSCSTGRHTRAGRPAGRRHAR
jgi:hypothetical protein